MFLVLEHVLALNNVFRGGLTEKHSNKIFPQQCFLACPRLKKVLVFLIAFDDVFLSGGIGW